MKKHAYLIIAHNEMQMLQKLVSVLDDERNDIYIHIDKKTRFFDEKIIRDYVCKSKLFFVKRMDVRWGHYSQVECELELLKRATENDRYHYYHLLSGVDFPLKSQDYIHEFLKDKDNEYISYHKNGDFGDDFLWKVQLYHPLIRWVGRGIYTGKGKKEKILRKLGEFQWKITEWQKKHAVNRLKNYPDYIVSKGSNWFSITDDCARYVLSRKRRIRKLLKITNGPDEFLMQLILLNSEYKNRVVNDNLRKTDWNRGTPYEFAEQDYEELINSPAFFARKISYNNSPKLVDLLSKSIIKKELNEREEPKGGLLVSIVVPIYNVEQYLPECIESLINQTYQNIEIILVNDGTKDLSRNIAAEYAGKDRRIKIIDQDNQGLSAARNTGIKAAEGSYIAFVDSDDWVEKKYIEKMYCSAVENNTDMSVCGFTYEYEDRTGESIVFNENGLFSREKMMHCLSNIFQKENLLSVVAWNKLYKRSIFKDLCFKTGIIHEDEFAAHRAIDRCNTVSTVAESLYHYRQRENSITGSQTHADTRHFHILQAHEDRIKCCRSAMYDKDYTNIVYSYFEVVKELLVRYDEKFFAKRSGRKILRHYTWNVLRTYGSVLPKAFKRECYQMVYTPVRYRRMLIKLRNSKKEGER